MGDKMHILLFASVSDHLQWENDTPLPWLAIVIKICHQTPPLSNRLPQEIHCFL